MSLPQDFNRKSSRAVYQPSLATKLILAVSLITTTFVIPYTLFMPQESMVGAEENGSGDTPIDSTPDDPGNTDVGGEIPAMLTFAADESIPESATLSLATPYESGWDITNQEEGTTTYNYSPLSCIVTTEVLDMQFSATGKDASAEVMSNVLGKTVLANNPQLSVAELTYNITSTAQFLGVGNMVGNKYEWTYARALVPIEKGIAVTTSCSSKEAMYESSDNLRNQFGILLKP